MLLVALLVLTACHRHRDPEAGPAASDAAPRGYDFYVDQFAGDDTYPGTMELPFRTITRGLKAAGAWQKVKVQPGLYGWGEEFPIVVPENVTLIGDEAFGAGVVTIAGAGRLPDPFYRYWAALDPRAGSAIVGFTISNETIMLVDGLFVGVFLRAGGIVLRGNQITKHRHIGIYFGAGSTDAWIQRNLVSQNGTGVIFEDPEGESAGSRLEQNEITENSYGVRFAAPGGDLGGGPAGSLGQNVLARNTNYDLAYKLSGGVFPTTRPTIYARDNYWDHVPPSISTEDETSDIYNVHGADFDTSGALLAE